jgi:hypothetical protein
VFVLARSAAAAAAAAAAALLQYNDYYSNGRPFSELTFGARHSK